ncbi:aldehyde dehydrogenase [Pleurotus eryngii]|uniref:Aldehyde dehydrogenase n=1 Tax=Pleurotus eryngii TaxID=5323 RepID=A0A9P6AA94_PLEER|nr:aldehyde dehydrogenase [Pleurotus eryngii]
MTNGSLWLVEIRRGLGASFRQGVTPSLEWRRHQLLQLARMAQDHAEEWLQAIVADLGRPIAETHLMEVGPIVERAIVSAAQLETWTTSEVFTNTVPDWQKSWKPTIYRAAKGVVLIFGPWNFPMTLTLQPLSGAIAAGCCAVVKHSEVATRFASLLAKLLPQYLDPSAFRVVLGGPDVGASMMKYRFFFTGGEKIGRIIAAAAGKLLTPATLELGGKSPVIIDSNYDIKLAAKCLCVSLDHVYVAQEKQEELIAALKECYHQFSPDGALGSGSIGHIVNETHFNRFKSLLTRTQGTIVLGGQTDDKLGMEPTIVTEVTADDSLMEEELFGPILPILPVISIEDAISRIRSGPHPLMMSVFTDHQEIKKNGHQEFSSPRFFFAEPAVVLANTIIKELPLGGIGASASGYYNPRYGFDTFSYLRSSIVGYTLRMICSAEQSSEFRYPPFTEKLPS